MKTGNTRSKITPKLIQLEQLAAGIRAEIKEIKKHLGTAHCFQLEQHAAGMQAEIKEIKKHLGRAKEDEDEDATIFFRLGGLVRNTDQVVGYDFTWFALPPRGVVDKKGHICSVFKEPFRAFVDSPRAGSNRNTPLAVGPFIFLISNVEERTTSPPQRRVLYFNTQKKNKGWEEASPIVGKHALFCHFIVANDKIYTFGPVDEGNSSLHVSFFDSQDPVKGWQLVEARSRSSTGLSFSFKVIASTVEYDTTTTTPIKGKPDRRKARRALLFANGRRISYDFEDETYEISEEPHFADPFDGDRVDGDDFYSLVQDFFDDSIKIKVFDHDASFWCITPIIGLDKYLPVASRDDDILPPLKLVHLGNKRLCLVWTLCDRHGANTQVHCTKFSFTLQRDGRYRATKVYSQVYKVKASHSHLFGAVAVV